MDLPLSVALLMAHPVPFNVLQPLLDALPVNWAEVPARRLVDALIEGSSTVRQPALPQGKDELAHAVLPRLTWTPEEADTALVKAWAIGPGTTPHTQMSLAITDAVAPFASPLGRTKALKRVVQRDTSSTRYGAEHVPPLVNRLLSLGCEKVWGGDSPYLTVATLAVFERLKDEGFPLLDPITGKSLDARLRQRAPDSFDSPSDRQKILAATPTPEMPPGQTFLYRLNQAQRWTDLRAALKDIGPIWTTLRFDDGESVLHKVARKDPEWSIKLFSLPAMRTAPDDIAIDGHGKHLLGRLMFSPEALKQAETLDHPAWTCWAEHTTPVGLLTEHLREQRRRAQHLAADVPSTDLSTALVGLYWSSTTAIEPWLVRMGSSMDEARLQALTDPGFQTALDAVAWNWPAPEYAYYALEKLLDPLWRPFTNLTGRDASRPSHELPQLAWFTSLPEQDRRWVATHMLGMTTRFLSLSQSLADRLVVDGANVGTLDRLFQEGRLAWKKSSNDDHVWATTVRARWETQQLRSSMDEDTSVVPESPGSRRRL